MITRRDLRAFGLSVSAFLVVSFLLGFYWVDIKKLSNKFKYEGTYSLYIDTQDGYTFHWITEENNTGVFELATLEGDVIEQGNTAEGKVHAYKSNWDGKNTVQLTFGSASNPTSKLILRPNKQGLQSVYSDVDSLFVVGDVHGRYDQLINLLQKSRVIDDQLNWIAGSAHVVFLGDLFDRGNDVTKVLWFIYQLERAADAAGGKVHLVLGNHEIMTMSKDLRYVGPKERAMAATFGVTYDKMFHPTHSFLGQWLMSKPSVLKIDKLLFAHGGVIDLGTSSIEAFNKQVVDYA